MLTGDFGISYAYRTPVSGMIADRLAVRRESLAGRSLGLTPRRD